MSKDEDIIEEFEEFVQDKFKDIQPVKLPRQQIKLSSNSLNIGEEKLKDSNLGNINIVEHKKVDLKPKKESKPIRKTPELW